MGQYDVDKDLYTKWFEDKTSAIEKMSREDIESRIIEIHKIEFFAKREWAMLHQQYDKVTGRKGIAPWLKDERDKLITDPNIQVNWDGDPRKKEKKPKENMLEKLLGINLKEGMAALKNKGSKEKETKVSMEDTMALLITDSVVVEPVNKATQEEINDKAAKLKERMRLAKEAALKVKE